MNVLRKSRWLFSLGIFLFMIKVDAQQIKVKCMISDCEGDIGLYEYNGFTFKKSMEAQKISENIFELSLPKMQMPRVYFIGPNNEDLKPIILGPENMVSVAGKCGKMRVAQITNSKLNDQFDELKKDIGSLRNATIDLARQLRMAKGEEERQDLLGQMSNLDEKKKNLLDSLNKANPFFAKTVALNTYLSYQNNQGEYKSEIMYFAYEYFAFADFKEEAYNYLPWLTDAVRTYTETLTRVGLDEGSQKRMLDQLVQRFPKESRARQYALAGIIQSYQGEKNGNFVAFGEQFIEEYKEKEPEVAGSLEDAIERERSFMIGGVAPDFAQTAPEGATINLSDLRGKIVLVDFWASWCGPCRRENPNVVRLYEKYKDKGFEILGVSLDRNREKWLQAIEQDGLEWLHVSDLKGWQNEVAQQYNVSSIPQTLLLDAEGKIIGKNLRGQRLVNKLAELFEGTE